MNSIFIFFYTAYALFSTNETLISFVDEYRFVKYELRKRTSLYDIENGRENVQSQAMDLIGSPFGSLVLFKWLAKLFFL